MSSTALTRLSEPLSQHERFAAAGVALSVAIFLLAVSVAPVAAGITCAVVVAAIFWERPFPLLLLMVFLIPFNFVFAVGSVPVAVELLKLFAWVPFILTTRTRERFTSSRYTKWFMVWAVIVAISFFRSNDLPYTFKESVRLFSNIGLVYLALNLVDTREKMLQVFRVLAFSTFLVACYGFYQWTIHDYGALFWIVNPRLNTHLAHYRDTFWPWRNRMISVLTSEMELGHYFNMCLPIGAALWLIEGRRRLTSKWLVFTLSMFAGLLLTFTFGSWLALAATLGFFVLLLDRKRRWKFVAVAVVVALCGILLIMGPLRPLVEAKFSGAQIGSFQWDVFTRLKAWVFAFQTWRAHPLLGVGVGNYEVLSAEVDWLGIGPIGAGSTPHETYLYLLAESGLVGFISIMIVFLSSIRSDLNLKSHPQLGIVGLALGFAILVDLIGGFSDDSGFVGPHTSYLLWLLIGLSEALLRIARPNLALSSTQG